MDSMEELPPRAMLGVTCKKVMEVMGSVLRCRGGYPSGGRLEDPRGMVQGGHEGVMHVSTSCTASPARTMRPKCQCSSIPSSIEMSEPRVRCAHISPKTMVLETGWSAILAATLSASADVKNLRVGHVKARGRRKKTKKKILLGCVRMRKE